jgi:single-strand DNA-binding protein
MSVNRVILVGRLGHDPSFRSTAGAGMCNFSLATDETFKDRAGERQKRTEWHKVVIWGKLADIAKQYLHKGSLVYLEGKIQTREWEKDGQKRTAVEIVVSTMRMLGDGNAAKAQPSQAPSSDRPETDGPYVPTDEDIPF